MAENPGIFVTGGDGKRNSTIIETTGYCDYGNAT